MLIDAVSVRKAEVESAPSIPQSTTLYLSGRTKLDLDFPGTIKVDNVYINGRRASKTVNAVNYPDYVTGMGAVEPLRLGMVLIFR